ncbi:MAG: TadE/TadG family type IV pilus assembly protein [Arachnia sp.]
MRRDQHGHAVAIEAAIILPALIALVALVIFGARVALADQALGAAAAGAARAASLERSAVSAEAAAKAAVEASLAGSLPECHEPRVSLDVEAVGTQLGTSATVRVTVSCRVPAGIGFGLPAEMERSQTRTAPVDAYRSREP